MAAQRKATRPNRVEQTTTRLPVVLPKPRPEPPDYRRARQLELDAVTCRWQAPGGIRCVRRAVEVMELHTGVARSSCELHVINFLRTGYRRLR